MKSNHPITSRKTTCSWKKSGGTMLSVTRHRNSRERGEKKFFFSILSCKTAFLWNQRLRQWRDLGGGVFEYLQTNSPRRGIPTISVKMNVRLWQADDNIGGALRDIQKKKTRLQMRLTINPFYFALFFSDFQLCHFEFVAISNRFVCRPWQNVPSTHYAKQVSTAASLSEQFYVHSNSAIDLLQY